MVECERTDLLGLMLSLRERREAYVLATVVETEGSVSASPGSKALISRDGLLLAGWVGGGCAEAAVREAALECPSATIVPGCSTSTLMMKYSAPACPAADACASM